MREKCKAHPDKYIIHEDGKTYCMKCANVLNSSDIIKRTHDEGT